MEYSVFVIDDDFAMRDALLTVLRARGIRARGFASGVDFFANLPETEYACVVTDMRMPQMDGAEVVRRLAEVKGADWPVIVITGHAEVSMAVQMMKEGILDFIEKPFDPNRLIEAVEGCLGHLAGHDVSQEAREDADRRLALLTPRERQVFDALVDGLSNKQIALQLDISPRTVEIFRAKVMQKMQTDNLAALVRIGILYS